MVRQLVLSVLFIVGATPAVAQSQPVTLAPATVATPLAIGESFTVTSAMLGEVRRINVYAPPGHVESPNVRLPVLYMPDGGIGEDFLHVAGLVQVLVGNGTMRPMLLVGIENTERRRDLTGPTTNEDDWKIAPRVGGSAAFRAFLRAELKPLIATRYRTSGETAIVGESLAGLFVVETFLREPALFDTYLAFDPSLWWNNGELAAHVGDLMRAPSHAAVTTRKTLFLASSAEASISGHTQQLATALEQGAFPGVHWEYVPMPEERHATIYHPAALRAFRTVFKPPVPPPPSDH